MKRRGLIFNSRPDKAAMFVLGLMLGLCPVSQAWADTNITDSQVVAQAQKKVKGQVIDATGEPLIGVNISVIGGTEGTITDIDGNYAINVPAGAKLKFSYIGYKDQIIDVAAQTVINVKLQEDSEVLDEVVVVGYGSQKKETLTGAVTVVSDKMLTNKGSMSSPVQALQGQVPGVIITRSSGAPGDESWGMKLRGAVSANSTDPLVIIDGVEYESVNELRLLNSADIESINFLKDASAAIYGSKAAGGVVLVTTKQAKEGKAKIEYSGSYTHKFVGLQPKMMSIDQWSDAIIAARTNDGKGADDQWIQYAKLAKAYKGGYIDLSVNPNPITAFGDVDDYVFMDTNWQDVLFGNAGSTQHNLSVSGGNDKSLYRLSVGYMYDDSTLKWGNNSNKRFNLRLTNTVKLTDDFTIESVIAYNRQDQVSPTMIGSVLTSSYPQPGLPSSTMDGKPYHWGGNYTPNWYAELGGDNNLKVSGINISENLKYKLTSYLDAVVNLGYNTSTATRDAVKNSITWYTYDGTLSTAKPNAIYNPNQASTEYSKSFARTDYYSVSGYLNFHQTFAEKHTVSAMLGAQYNLKEYDYTVVTAKDVQSSLEILNGSGDIFLKNSAKTSSPDKWQEAMMSYFGRFNYNYLSKYLLEANLRYDGSSKFLPENRWDFFYGFSGGWRLTEENFMKNVKFLNELKLRLSYGVVGNQSGISRYDGRQLYNFNSVNGAYLGDGRVSYVKSNGEIATTGRSWERIHNYNLGVDFQLFNSRLQGTVELFMKKNNNMLIAVTYPGILGDKAPASNSGKFEAKGYEGTLTWSDKIGKVNYHIGGTFTYADNKLVDYGGVTVFKSGFIDKQQGYSLNSVFGLKYCGKIQTEEQLRKYKYQYYNGNGIGIPSDIRLGDNMYEDVNGDGVLDEKDYVYLGSDDPKISYSFNLGLEWNNFDLSAVFQGVAKRTIFRDSSNDNYRIPMKAAHLNSTTQSVGDVWSPENRGGRYPTYTNINSINDYNYQCSSWSVENGNYLRLKSVTLGYNFPTSLLNKIRVISRMRVYVSGNDLWEVSKINDGWDPEASRKVSGNGRFPFNRTCTVGLDLTF